MNKDLVLMLIENIRKNLDMGRVSYAQGLLNQLENEVKKEGDK